jgi:hypothetical protein
VDFNTYLLKSGSRHGGQTGLGFGQPQGLGLLHTVHAGGAGGPDGAGVQEGSLEEKSPEPNPSVAPFLINAVLNIIPMRTPNNRSNPGTTILICLAIGGPLYSLLGNFKRRKL